MDRVANGATNKRTLERAKARTLLRKLDACETLAMASDPHRKPRLVMSPAEMTQWRQANSELYRKVVGIHPSRRDELRAALKRIATNGHGTVRAAVRTVNARDHNASARKQDARTKSS